MSDACPHEPHVRHAASENDWNESLRTHIERCFHCRAAAAVAPVMATVADVQERPRALPPATVIWLKAKLMRGNATLERVSRPINVMQIVAYLTVAAGWSAMVMWKWTSISQLISSPTNAFATSMPTTVIAAVVGLASVTFGLAMHTILAEE